MSAWQPQNASFESFSRKKNIKGQEALELNSPHSPNEGFQKQVASWGIVQAVADEAHAITAPLNKDTSFFAVFLQSKFS